MRAEQLRLISMTEGMEAVEQEVTSGALAGRVRARIARRPGRWREKMHALPHLDEGEPLRPEAA
jgi:hypothetical protein